MWPLGDPVTTLRARGRAPRLPWSPHGAYLNHRYGSARRLHRARVRPPAARAAGRVGGVPRAWRSGLVHLPSRDVANAQRTVLLEGTPGMSNKAPRLIPSFTHRLTRPPSTVRPGRYM